MAIRRRPFGAFVHSHLYFAIHENHWLNFSKLSVGLLGSSSRFAELLYPFPRSRFATGALGPIIAGAVIFLAAGMHLQAAPVVNADIARLLKQACLNR